MQKMQKKMFNYSKQKNKKTKKQKKQKTKKYLINKFKYFFYKIEISNYENSIYFIANGL
jgi:hypothetical protein